MIDYVFTTFAIAILICIVGLGICQFLKLSKDKQIEIIAEWLLLAVVKAEKTTAMHFLRCMAFFLQIKVISR